MDIKPLAAIIQPLLDLIRERLACREKKMKPLRYIIPRATLRLVPSTSTDESGWGIDSSSVEPIMLVWGSLQVTNITDENIYLAKAEMKKPKVFGSIHLKYVDPYQPKAVALASFEVDHFIFVFRIGSLAVRQRETFISHVAIVDNYGNRHWMRNLKFVYKEPLPVGLQ